MKRQTGFTLMELMIVLVIIGLLAAIALPRFSQILERSREGATKGNLSSLRAAICIYYSEKEGNFPSDLTTSFTSYLYPIPATRASPLGNASNISLASTLPNTPGTGWCYITDPASTVYRGNIYANSTATDSRGSSFTTY